MKRLQYYIIVLCLYALPVTAQILQYTQGQISYLVRVTNNSKKDYTFYCNNFDNRPTVFTYTNQLNNEFFTYNDTYQQNIAMQQVQHLYDLYNQKEERVDQLFRDGKSDQEINNDQQVQNINRVINQETEKLRPIIKPGQTLDRLPCRLYRVKDFPDPKPPHWILPETFLQNADNKINIVDTDTNQGCDVQKVRIEARSKKSNPAVCIDNSADNGKVHLIINPDETLTLKPVVYDGSR